MTGETYRVGSVVTGQRLPRAYGPEGEPVRPLISETTGDVVAYVREDAGPVYLWEMDREELRERYGDALCEALDADCAVCGAPVADSQLQLSTGAAICRDRECVDAAWERGGEVWW